MQNPFQLIRKNNCEYLQAIGPHADLDLVFTTRRGGVSFDRQDLNMSRGTGDSDENVMQNRERIFSAIGASRESVAILRQVHGTRIISPDDQEIPDFNAEKNQADGLLSRKPGSWLSISIGDCVPVCIYDSDNRILVMLHSGWRSTAGQIAGCAVALLKNESGSRPERLRALIGPGISAASYQVDAPVLESFDRNPFDFSDVILDKSAGHGYLDIHQAIETTLLEGGLLRENVQHLNLCTHTLQSLFFSHRRDGLPGGRMMAMARIRP